MIKVNSTLLGAFTLLTSLSAWAQSGADPAVTSRDLQPAPVTTVGSPFSMTFTVGNNGTAPITGVGFNERMSVSICLGKCDPLTADPIAALSGSALNYFDVTFTPPSSATASDRGCYEFYQKSGVAIGPTELYNIVIAAKVFKASSTTAINDIGANCNIAPNPNSGGQPTDNDQASIYTHTTVVAMPVALVSFTAQAQADRTVLLNWKSSWERANKGYVIERSKDLKSFEPVGEVNEVAGTSSSLSTYRFVDSSPYRGTSYYRLRQVDVDGSSQVFKAEPVVIDGRYGVYPNPVVSQSFTLELDEPTSAVLHLYNASGSELGLGQQASSGSSTQVQALGKLSSGVYILTVEERGTTRKHRLVVQ